MKNASTFTSFISMSPFGPRKQQRWRPKDFAKAWYFSTASGGPVPTMAVPTSGNLALESGAEKIHQVVVKWEIVRKTFTRKASFIVHVVCRKLEHLPRMSFFSVSHLILLGSVQNGIQSLPIGELPNESHQPLHAGHLWLILSWEPKPSSISQTK